MLIDSPRLSPQDRHAWQQLERYDQKLGPHLTAKTNTALQRIRGFWADEPSGVCSVSWGKDSTVIADLVATTGLPIPIVWVRSDPFEMPECDQVRDVFLNHHPHVIYEERVAVLRNPKRGQEGYEAHHMDPGRRHQDILKEHITGRYISGVRAQESRIRRSSARWHGAVTQKVCRPIIDWTGAEVFAYLNHHHLPVHPAYAMTYGGQLDRQWLRVHPLCSYHEESSIHGQDKTSWEDHYYTDTITTALKTTRGIKT